MSNVYQYVNERIISGVEKEKFLEKLERTKGHKHITRKEYRELMPYYFPHLEYLTFKQVTELKGKVKGEKANMIVYYIGSQKKSLKQ